MRAFRPSRFAPPDEHEEDHERDKAENVQRYAKRAAAGIPLFDAVRALAERSSHSSDFLAHE
jgi:hypothetical protein